MRTKSIHSSESTEEQIEKSARQASVGSLKTILFVYTFKKSDYFSDHNEKFQEYQTRSYENYQFINRSIGSVGNCMRRPGNSDQMTYQICNQNNQLKRCSCRKNVAGLNQFNKRTTVFNFKTFIQCLALFTSIISSNGQSPANNDQPFASILYTGVLRGKVALPCDVSAPSEDDSVALILWYKDDALAPIYTLDARKGSLDQARTLTSSLLEGRAFFNLHNKPAFLQIDPIKLEDAGDYRCRVDFKKARTVNTVISFKVIVPPEEPEIKDANGKVLRGLIGPYAESSGLKLICSTVGGKPRPSLTWFRDYTLLDDSFEYNEDVTTNTVLIPSLTRHHLLSVFTCQASNNNITVPISTSITLDLNLKPSEVRITQLSPTLVVNREARFQCSTIGARPQARVYFLFNGLRKDTKLNCKPDSQCLAVLTIQITKEMNGASLRCVAENPRILKSEITDQIKLDVQYAPQLNLKLGSATLSLQSIQEGNDIYFDCEIDANPMATKPITWRFNGETIQSQTGVIQSNQTLVLQSVTREQSGIYQCEVANKQGTSLSNPIDLKVKFAPVCQTDYVFVFGVTFHETVHLRCDVDSNPNEVSFFWKLHNSHQLDLVTYNQFENSESKRQSSILTYSPQMQQDYGIIECSAKNSVGIQQTPCYFQLVPAKPPVIDLNCELRNMTENSFVVACAYDNTFHLFSSKNRLINQTLSADIDNHLPKSAQSNALAYKKALYIYPITFYVCEVYFQDQLISTQNLTIHNPYTNTYLDIIDSKELKTISRKSGRKNEYNKFKFLINHLTANSDYEIKISALNRKGTGRPVTLSATTKKKPDRLFITKITDQHSSGLDGDQIKNDLNSLHWLSNQQIASVPVTYLLSIISICLGIMIFILIIRKRYKRLILMHSTLRSNQFQSTFATSSNTMSISKCLFPYNKKPELTNEQYEHEHTLMGCCNVDYREDILMSRHSGRQLTTFTGLNQEIDNTNSLQLQAAQTTQNQQQLCELNTASMHFNTYSQLANRLTNSLTNNNLASSCSTRDLYEAACLFNNNNLNSLGNLNAVSSNLALAAPTSSLALTASNNNCSSPGPPISPPPTYEQSTSMLSLPPPPTSAMLQSNSTTNKLYDCSPFNNSLIHHPQSYVDYTNRYQSLNRKVHPKLEEFKQNNLVVNLDVCTNLKNFNSKSLERMRQNEKRDSKH